MTPPQNSVIALLALLIASGCNESIQSRSPGAGRVDGARIIAADKEPGNWLTHGRTYDEQRFSPLKNINRDNVDRLGLAWEHSTDSVRGLEATPVIVDGVMYTTSTWSRVMALDAKTGALLWEHDPKVQRAWAKRLCCDIVNRGVAVWNGNVFVGTLDGYLVALDAATGEPVWRIDTLIDRDQYYSITGAPRVVKDKVIIGNGGAEFDVRGYVSAYDSATGRTGMAVLHGTRQRGWDRSSMRNWRWPRQLGTRTAIGKAWAGQPGTRWLTTLNWICCISAPATVHPGRITPAVLPGATTCSWHPSWPCSRIRVAWSGTTRRLPAMHGTTRPRST